MITGGQSYVSAPPAFSADGRFLLVCSGRTVGVFSTSTAMLVSELEGHEGDVTAVVVMPPPANAAATAKLASYCWTAGLDGVLIYWDFAAAELVRKVQVGLPVHSMAIPNISRTSRIAEVYTPFAFVSVEDTSKPDSNAKALRGQMRIYDLTKGRQVGGLLAETRKPEKIVASSSGEFLGITNKRKLYIWSIPTKDFKPDKIRKIKLRHTKNLNTLSFHPSERIVSGGDVTGRVLIWRGFGNAKFSGACGAKSKVDEERDGVRGIDDANTCTTWHWHSSGVKFLKFSSDGAYLFSGGMEGVIVVWQLDTGKRRYKPRLGSPLLFFVDSPDSSISCVSCTNNQVHLLKMPNMEVMKSIAGIKLPIASPDLGRCCQHVYGFDYENGLVAIPTEDYCIQFYNLFENTEVSEVQVCERNFQPVDDSTMYISLVSLSIDGNIMCTVDVKLPEEELGGLVTLKFWNHGSRSGQYFLSTIIYEPHSDAGISAVAFCPGKNMAVSSSLGGNFKVWVQSPSLQREKSQSGWRCQSVGSYKKKPMTAAAFSADGSVLAVAAESVITLWDPDNNALVGVIAEALSPVTKLSFVGTSAFLMTLSQSSRPQIAVWNVSNLSMQWSYSLFAEAACCSSSRSEFAVLALLGCPDGGTQTEQDGVILLFNAENPNPVSSWSAKKAKGGSVAFVKRDPSLDANTNTTRDGHASLLVYVNSSHEYVIFDPRKNEESQISKSVQKNTQAEEPAPIGYASIYGELPKVELKKEVSDIPFTPSERPWETIFSGSSHVLPPLTKLCSAFLASLLEKRQIANE